VALFRFQIRTGGYDFIELICMASCSLPVLETVFQVFINRIPFSDVLFTNVTADIIYYHHLQGAHGGVVVKALRYKPAGCGFDSRWCHWNFSVT
jgi:hypothetical protein